MGVGKYTREENQILTELRLKQNNQRRYRKHWLDLDIEINLLIQKLGPKYKNYKRRR